jgi:hypothetical protein
MECCVRSWILGSVDSSVLDLAMDEPNPNAHDLWVVIEIFRTNKEPRAIFLLNEFHSMVQGDSTISAYCQHLKTKAAALSDVGHPVEGSQLVLALLRGLNPRFSNTADDIANSTVLPSFARAHDMLVLKAIRLANDEKTIVHTTLLARGWLWLHQFGRVLLQQRWGLLRRPQQPHHRLRQQHKWRPHGCWRRQGQRQGKEGLDC